jgi:hypothetical protein
MALLRAPYGLLSKILGPPSKERPEKCSTCWVIESPADTGHEMTVKDVLDEDDATFTINAFRGLPHYDWTVEGEDAKAVDRFCKWLSTEVISEAKKTKTLSPESKAKLNELLKQGIAFDTALKQLTWESPAAVETKFAWPIADGKKR